VLAAKTAAQLDHAAEGWFILGLGVGNAVMNARFGLSRLMNLALTWLATSGFRRPERAVVLGREVRLGFRLRRHQGHHLLAVAAEPRPGPYALSDRYRSHRRAHLVGDGRV
jgi:alkanesulfonate monooxygenase SsuD/methylene tetrahydromethanopterin reductase-like flavin-dependent oxidoreductase (luciferase family)